MLTPDQIKNKEFHTTGKGSYRSEEVDDFMKEVYSSYEKVFRENGEIIKKMSILANKVEEYKKDEDSLRQALLAAQKLADQITAEAKENAEKQIAEAKLFSDEMIAKAKGDAEALAAQAKTEADEKLYNANKEANEIIGGVNRKVTQERLVLEMLQKEVGAFKNKMMDMYKEHLTLLDRLPSLAEEQAEEDPAEEAAAEVAEEPVEQAAEEVVTLENIADEAEEAVEEAAEAEEEPALVFESVSEDNAEDEFVLDVTDDESAADLTDEFARIEEADEFKAPELVTYEPYPSAEDDGEAIFSVDDSALEDEAAPAADTFEDVASGSEEDDGFSLNFEDLDDLDDLDEEDDDAAAEEPKAIEYASADEMADDEDDDNGVSFKHFFKKK